jgi:DNA-directed RNA polymerase subunit M/transcription elongation factor TFIIS
MTKNTWKNIFSTKLLSNFCPDCGTLVSFPAISDFVVCNICGYSVRFSGKILNMFIDVLDMSTPEISNRKVLAVEREDRKDEEKSRATVIHTIRINYFEDQRRLS